MQECDGEADEKMEAAQSADAALPASPAVAGAGTHPSPATQRDGGHSEHSPLPEYVSVIEQRGGRRVTGSPARALNHPLRLASSALAADPAPQLASGLGQRRLQPRSLSSLSVVAASAVASAAAAAAMESLSTQRLEFAAWGTQGPQPAGPARRLATSLPRLAVARTGSATISAFISAHTTPRSAPAVARPTPPMQPAALQRRGSHPLPEARRSWLPRGRRVAPEPGMRAVLAWGSTLTAGDDDAGPVARRGAMPEAAAAGQGAEEGEVSEVSDERDGGDGYVAEV